MTEIIKPAMTVRDVATMLNVDEKTIYRLVQKGSLPGFKVAGSWRFQWSDIQTWIDSKSKPLHFCDAWFKRFANDGNTLSTTKP